MSILLLLLTIVTLTAQNVFTKQYGKRESAGPVSYAAVTAFSSLLVFIVASGFHFAFNPAVLTYAVMFALAYSASTIGLMVALKNGPLSITSLLFSYSLIIPTLYGILCLNEPVKVTMCVGFALLVLALAMVNFTKKQPGQTGFRVNAKWLVSLLIAFIGNGLCSTIQKMQQVAFDSQYNNEFMIIALIIVTVLLLIVSLLTERKQFLSLFRGGWYWAVSCGLTNGLTNLFVLILTGMVAVSLMFPVISAGNIILASLISIYFYKEKLQKTQLLGIGVGVVSIIFLNI